MAGTAEAVWGSLRLNDVAKAAGNDSLTFYNAADSSQLPLGIVDLNRVDYTNKTISIPSTMMQNGNAITFVIGARQLGSGAPDTALGAGTMVWTPANGATDLVGNPASTTAVTEPGAADADF